MEIFKLSKLNEYIQRVIALNFENPLWITAELIQAKLNKGHYYLELAERNNESDDIIAQSSAVIWKTNWLNIVRKLNDFELRAGINIKIKALVEYHPRFGLKLNVIDLDASYSLGEIARKRQEIIARLIAESLWQINKTTILPLVLKNIAVITSLSSAGRRDFESHLIDNPNNYTFRITYYEATMQGSKTALEVVKALRTIHLSQNSYDCIAIIRGGGAKLDLIDFDSYEIAREISLSTIPILTGIGHEQDESIIDLTSYLKLKTPTAVADYIIEHNKYFENSIQEKFHFIKQSFEGVLEFNIRELSKTKNNIYLSSYKMQQNLNYKILSIKNSIGFVSKENYQKQNLKLVQITHLLESNNPLEILKKGFTMTYQNDKRIKKKSDLHADEEMLTIFEDGKIISSISKI